MSTMTTTDPLLLAYSIADLCLALFISLSNIVVIILYLRAKHIRAQPTNVYIFSLAVTDFLAGTIGIPLTVASVLTRWPFDFFPCLAIHLILCVLCTISTFHLLAMAVDRYLSICVFEKIAPQHNSAIKSIRKRRAQLLILGAWTLGTFLGSLPLLDGFAFATTAMANYKGECHFTDVVDYRYLVFIIFFGTIIVPSVLIACCYFAIYAHIRHEERPLQCHLRDAEKQRRNLSKRKLIRVLIILVMTFAICWYPLYTINTFDLFFKMDAGRTATLFAVVLSHANCALNPLIYAYGVPGFKQHLRRYFPFFSPVSNISMQGGTLLPGTNAHAAWAAGANGINNNRKAMVDINRQRRQSMAPLHSANTAYHHHQQQYYGRRTVSTAVNPAFSSNAAMLRESSARGSVAQFRRHQNVVVLEQKQQQQQQQQQNSTETTDETVAAVDEILEPLRAMSSSCDNSCGTTCSLRGAGKCNNEDWCNVCASGGIDDRKRSGQSIASRISVWSLRIFSGQWRVLRRRTSSAQSLKGNGDGGGTMLVENRNRRHKVALRFNPAGDSEPTRKKPSPSADDQHRHNMEHEHDEEMKLEVVAAADEGGGGGTNRSY